MEVVKEAIASGIERTDPYSDRTASGNDFLDAQHIAFEFRWYGIEVFLR